jgi:putative hemolysin
MMNGAQSPRLIDLGRSIESPIGRGLFRLVESPLGRMLSLSTINRLYAESLSLDGAQNYFTSILRVLNVDCELSDEDLAKIPEKGPVMVVANHPFGAIEGVILGQILTRRRPDIRLLGNHWLAEVPEMRDWVIPVDPWGGEEAVRANIAPLKSALRWLKGGAVLGTFPSGTVSHLQVRKGQISDPPWHPTVAALARRTGATVVPVFFEGRNSMVFQLAGLIHPALRTALLPNELLRRSNSKVGVRIGRPIGEDKIARYPEDETLIEYLRWKTYMLQRRESPVRPRFVPRTPVEVPAAPVAEPVPGSVMAAEVERLPAQNRLCELGDQQVFIAEARQIPAVLREIGRLREVTFRAVGEGTAKAIDTDRFDDSYLHLFMWNKAKTEVVGSYRLGCVDEILAREGSKGLYTSSLFKFRAGFLERLGPSLELGRSFVRQEYQRKATSLALLWRGIGEYLVRNPRYKLLFGPVSISRDYDDRSRRLMIEYLETHHFDEDFAALVKAKNPPRERLDAGDRKALSLVRDADDVSALVSEIEEDNKGMPVLLRHYLKLNARLLSFNVDPAFGHCTDGLIVVDLRTADAKMLKRFMGDEGYAFYASAGEAA